MNEIGHVVGFDTDAIWVETQQKTTCGNCVARKGCGQSLLSSLHENSRQQLRLPLGSVARPALGAEVEFSVPDNALLLGSGIVYLLPLGGMILAAVMASALGLAETWQLMGAGFGLAVGLLLAKRFSSHAITQACTPTIERVLPASPAEPSSLENAGLQSIRVL